MFERFGGGAADGLVKVQLLACRKVVIKMVSWCVSEEWLMVEKLNCCGQGREDYQGGDRLVRLKIFI